MKTNMRMELVVTRAAVPEYDYVKALEGLREIQAFANARGLVIHAQILLTEDGPENKEKN